MEKETENEEYEEESSKSKEIVSRYTIPIAIIFVFVTASLITNAVDTSISGAAIANLRSEYEKKINDLETGSVEKSNLQLEKEKLQDEVDLYSGILTGLDDEMVEIHSSIYGFQIIWDSYITVEPNEDYTWFVDIKNTARSERTYSIGLEFKSNKDGVFDKKPTAGSLILMPGNSGTLNIRMSPKKTGYAIFELFVNGNYVGDLVVFSI